MKKTLCALVIGISSVIGCENNNIRIKQPEGGDAIVIPYDCAEVKCMDMDGDFYKLVCVDKNDKAIYYTYTWIEGWKRYDLIRENKK